MKAALTVQELETLKQALLTVDNSQKNLISKLWTIQSDLIKTEIKNINKNKGAK